MNISGNQQQRNPSPALQHTSESHSKILTLKSAHGLNAKTKNNIWFIDEANLVYPVGRTLVFHNINGTQSYVKGSKESMGITAMSLVPNRKYIAVAEKGKSYPTITFYDTLTRKKKKIITHSDAGSQEFVSFTFSSDGKFMIAQAGGPHYKLILWSMEGKSKVVASIGTSTSERDPVYQCSMSPDNKYICVTGNGIFKLLKYDEGTLKQVVSCSSLVSSFNNHNFSNSRKPTDTNTASNTSDEYVYHAWLDDTRLVISNRNGDLYLVEDMELRGPISTAPSDGKAINTIVPYNGGFVCGSDNGTVTIFEPTDANEHGDLYKKTKNLKLAHSTLEMNDTVYDFQSQSSIVGTGSSNYEAESNPLQQTIHRIMNFGLSPSNETLAITTNTGQIFTLNLTSSDILQEQDVKFYYLTNPFHSQKITGLDTCARKPLIVTCSSDRSIRIWNYLDNSLLMVRRFSQEIYSVAMHPNGLHLVVGFQDKLRFMNLLGNNDIREAKSFHVRNCPEVKFSNGGQYFAAVHGNVINVYDTHTLLQLHSLRGHSGKIRCLHWLDDDNRLVSAGMDGAVYEYVLATEKRIVHHFNKSCEYTSVINEGKSILAVGTDKMLREFQDGEVISQVPTGENSWSCIESSHIQKLLFCASTDGSILVYPLPPNLTSDTLIDDSYCHGDSINRIKLIHDETLLISVSEDGCMCIFEVKDREGGRLKRDTKYSEEILIASSDLEEKNNTIADLNAKVVELKSDNEYEQKKKALEYNERLKEQAAQYQEELSKKDERINQMKAIIDQTKTELEQKIEELVEEHVLELSKKEKECQDKITGFVQQIQHIKAEFSIERDDLIEKIKDAEEMHQSEISKIAETHEDEMVVQRGEYEKLKLQSEEKTRDFIERIKQIEEDRDREIEKIKNDFTEKAKQLQQNISVLSGERKSAQTDKEKIQNALNEQKKVMKDITNKLQTTKDKKDHFENEATNLKNENREREETIVDKEKKIFELKRQNQELEKFKFVLQYKITTLEEEIRPNKEQINKLRHEMKQMEKELDKFKEMSEEQLRGIEDLKLQISAKNKEIQRLRNKLKDSEVFKSRIRSDIHDVVQGIQEPKRLKEDVKNLYQKHVNKSIKKQEMDYDIQREYDRQRNYLEKTVESLKKKLLKATETSKTETNRVIHENMELIKEINILRKDVRTLNSKLREKEEAGVSRFNKFNANSSSPSPHSASTNNLFASGVNGPIELTLEEAKRNIELQKITIRNLRDRIDELEAQIRAQSRPISRERLPPMEGFRSRSVPLMSDMGFNTAMSNDIIQPATTSSSRASPLLTTTEMSPLEEPTSSLQNRDSLRVERDEGMEELATTVTDDEQPLEDETQQEEQMDDETEALLEPTEALNGFYSTDKSTILPPYLDNIDEEPSQGTDETITNEGETIESRPTTEPQHEEGLETKPVDEQSSNGLAVDNKMEGENDKE